MRPERDRHKKQSTLSSDGKKSAVSPAEKPSLQALHEVAQLHLPDNDLRHVHNFFNKNNAILQELLFFCCDNNTAGRWLG